MVVGFFIAYSYNNLIYRFNAYILLMHSRKGLYSTTRILNSELVKTLKIPDDTHRKLTEVGSEMGLFGKSYADVIDKLVDFYRKERKQKT
jgi:hypothetical protein